MKAADTLPVFTPRWLYRLISFIEGLPISGWLLVILLILVPALAMHFVAWNQGALPFGQISTLFLSAGLFLLAFYAPWPFLTRRARLAIEDFFKGSKKSSAQIETILSDFVSLPQLWGTLFFLLGAFIGILSYTMVLVPLFPQLSKVLPLLPVFIAAFSTGFAIVNLARIVRQFLIAQGLYREMKVDIFNPAPIYALSRFAAAGFFIIWLNFYVVFFLAEPALLLTPFYFWIQLTYQGIFFGFFIAQLLSISEHVRQAKESRLVQLGKDLEQVYEEVHKVLQKKGYAAVARMQASVVTLKTEQEMLQKIPAWPWQPETLRNVLTPLLIPIIVYLVQRYVGSMFGF